MAGRETTTFVSGSPLAPKFFKVVANSKKLVAISKDKQNFFYAVSVLDRPSKSKRRMTVLQIGQWYESYRTFKLI